MKRSETAHVIGITFIAALFFLIRLPVLHGQGLLFGWNSDAGIWGLMARAIASGKELPVFFWGQSYLGPLTPYLTAAIGLLIGRVDALALRLAACVEVLGGILLYWSALQKGFRPTAVLLACLWLATGPAFLFQFTISPHGAEQIFFLGAVIFWFAVRTELRRVRDWFVFGLLAGFSFWIHQATAFVFVAVAAVSLFGPHVMRETWSALALRARLLLRWDELGWRPLDVVSRRTLAAIHIALLILMVLCAFAELGFNAPSVFLQYPFVESFFAFLIFHFILEITLGTRIPAALQRARTSRAFWLPRIAWAALGAIIAYVPVMIHAFEFHPGSYSFPLPFVHIQTIRGRIVDTIRMDLWRLVGAEGGWWAVPLALALVVALVGGSFRRIESNPVRAIAALTIVLCAMFYFGTELARLGSMRYIVSAVPIIYVYSAEEILRWKRPAAIAVATFVTLVLLVPRVQQAQRVASGQGERFDDYPGAFDPLPVLREIEAQGYQVCYAYEWYGYKLEWVSNQRVRFISYRGYDRRPRESRRLSVLPGTKCFVTSEGKVQPFVPEDESVSRRARVRLMNMK